MALTLDGLADLAKSRGDLEEARQLYSRALAMHRDRGDEHSSALALLSLGEIAHVQGDIDAAAAGAREALKPFRQLGNQRGVAAALHLLGSTARAAGDFAAARQFYAEAVTLMRAGDHQLDLVAALGSLAALAVAERRWERAVRLGEAAEAMRLEIRAVIDAASRAEHAAALAAARAALDVPAYERAWAAGLSQTLDAALEEGLSILIPLQLAASPPAGAE